MTRSHVSVLVAGLADRGIGRRDADEHATRVVHLRLTPEGQRRVCSWRATHHRALLRTLPPVSDEQLATISVELELLLPALERPRKGKS
jgi:DNA-binding MarR family transcriptional regulator